MSVDKLAGTYQSTIRGDKKRYAWLSNPFLNHLFNHQEFRNSGSLKEVIRQLCDNPADYAILVPSTMFLMFNVDKDTGKSYSEICKELDFILSHIVRMDVLKESRIRTHKEFTTLSNKTVIIKGDVITSLKNFKNPVSVNIIKQDFIRGFAKYIPLGTCFHIIYITDCLINNFKFIGTKENLMETNNIIESTQDHSNFKKMENKTKKIKPFDEIVTEYPELQEILKKFNILFSEYTFKKCKSLEELEKLFVIVMKRGSAIFNTMEPGIFKSLIKNYHEAELRESVYNFLEANIYDRFWAKFVQISNNTYDAYMDSAYDKLKWLSITEVELPENIVGNPIVLSNFIQKTVIAIREFKTINLASNCSQKCKIIIDTVEALSAETTIDADTLIILLIFVICLAKIPNLNCHLKHIKQFAYSEKDIETGILGYALSSLEVAVKYFHDNNRLQNLISKSLQNEVLWRLIGAVSSDISIDNNKADDENIFTQIEALLAPFNKPNTIIPLESFIKSRTLNGESCLMFALQQNNEELMNVLLQFEYIFTLDDILEDQNIDGSNLLSVAIDMEHSSATSIAEIILQATPEEIKKYINQEDNNGRTVGHFLYNSYLLISDFGSYINWTKKDTFGNTPFMVYIRCYDHPHYDEMMALTLPIVKQWYIEHGKLFNHRDHLDNKGNTLMHTIRDSVTLKLFLKTFEDLEMNYLNDSNQSAVSLAVRYNRIENVQVLINDSRVCLSIVDPVMFLSALDYVKLERWGECVNREIAKLLEVQFTMTQYGESLDIACVRARFEPQQGLCCYFRVVNSMGQSDIILVPFSSLIKAFKLLKKENPCIPFDFIKTDIWFPKHSSVTMKGNISSSNKMKINSLINNLNLLIQALYKNGTLEHTETLQNYLLVPQEPGVLAVEELNERDAIKNIYTKNFGHKKMILMDESNFKRMIIKNEDIIAYEAFFEYTITELQTFLKLYSKFYRTVTLSDVSAKDLDKLCTDIPWIVDPILKHRESRVEDSSDIFLDKMRLLYATVEELIKVSDDMRMNKLRKWKKIVGDLKTIRGELDRVAGNGVDGSILPNGIADHIPNSNRTDILSKVFRQIDILTSGSVEDEHINGLRNDILKTVFKGDYSNHNDNDNKVENSTTKHELQLVTELTTLTKIGVESWFVEKRRISYVERLLESFFKYRNELIELDIELRKNYEALAMFVSKFYQFRIDLFKNAFKNYSKGKIGELKREVEAWELGLTEHKINVSK
jgi:hypothetical protein